MTVFGQSPIESGTWLKLKFSEPGIYKITFQDLKNAGLDMSGKDPRKIQIRGHQGGMLPELNGNRTTGLPEIAIAVVGESDGTFDANDYIYFYAGGPHKWEFDAFSGNYEHVKNIYSNESFLYIGVGAENGKRIQSLPSENISVDLVQEKTMHLFFHDSDIYNPASMGRTWLGEKLGNETLKRSFSYSLPAEIEDTVLVRTRFAGGMLDGSGTVTSKLNGKSLITPFSALNTEFESFRLSERKEKIPALSKNIDFQLELSRPNTKSAAWLDFIEIQGLLPIHVNQGFLKVLSPALQTATTAEIRWTGNASRIWNISNEILPYEIQAESGGTYRYVRVGAAVSKSQFIVFDVNSIPSAKFAGFVSNQNILSGNPAELLIITHADFATAANNLADFRKNNDGISSKVTQVQHIYNEYSASQQDIVAIRDYIRDEYNKSLKAGSMLKYVLLFGTASYDLQNRVEGNTNFVPIYHDYSTYKVSAFCLDDFYAYLDSGMGRPVQDANKMKLAVGRIPCRTIEEANAVVEKLKRYASSNALGPWRAGISFVCDDADVAWESEFVRESEKYAAQINTVHPDLEVGKIYCDAFKQVSTGNTEMYPDVSNAINNAMNNGALFLNYQGHGGEKGWAQEAVLTVPMIKSWKNKYKMPVMFTATCEFGRYDDPGLQSGGELSMLNPDGGAIALMTTTRLVYVSGNSQINKDFWTNYGFPAPNEPVPAIGDLYKKMKNRPSTTSEDNKFALLGDPSMKLAFPEHHIVLDSINGKGYNSYTDTIKAFSVVKIKGHVQKRLGGNFSDFNGNLWVKVYDKSEVKYTLDNDKTGMSLPYTSQSSFIYKGVVSVVNGEFTIVFSVPKDISYKVDFGKMVLYAHNGVTDASGSGIFKIGSSEVLVNNDNMGPQLKLFMNDTTFYNGMKISANSSFLGKVFDQSGINATGAGIGRDMIVVLDKNTGQEQIIVVNDFFNYDLNSYTNGQVILPFENLSFGKHTIAFKVWDIHNNSSESSIEFEVIDDRKLEIQQFTAWPNPFADMVTFSLTHNLAGEDLKGELQISDLSGRLLVKKKFDLPAAENTESRIEWDSRNINNGILQNGMYLYRIILTGSNGRMDEVGGKLIKN